MGARASARRSAVIVVVTALAASGCFLDRRGTRDGDAGPTAIDAAPVRADAGTIARDDAGPTPLDAGDRDAGEALEPPGPPGAPTFSDVGETRATLSWEAPSTGGPVVTYEVETAPDIGGLPGAFGTLVTGVVGPPLVDTGLSSGSTHWYRVRGVNAIGVGAPSEAASVTTTAPWVVTRVQTAEADGVEPTASFAAAPTEGNLLVAIVFLRLDTANPDIEGWDEVFHTHFQTNDGNRRGLAMFARVAGDDESAQVDVDWDPDRESRLLVMELSAGAPATWTLEDAVYDDSGAARVDEISLSSGVSPSGEQVWIGALGTRDDPNSDVAFDGMGMAISRRGSRTVAAAVAQAPPGTRATTTARWSTTRHATAGLAVYSLTPR